MEFIDKIGVELEGGWIDQFPEEDPTEIYADHSVHLGGFAHIGEVASKPLSLEEVLDWTSSHYPDGSDGTCGMHVHISTKRDEDYAKLVATPHFFMKFLLWGKAFTDALSKEKAGDQKLFLDRLSGKNRFCALKFIPMRQVNLKVKGGGNNIDSNPRYAMLNFAKGIHGTMENRTFPIFSKETALLAIKEYVEMVEKFLKERDVQKVEVFKVVS